MGLVTANQFNLTPDVLGQAGRGINLGEQFRQQQLLGKQREFLQGGGLQDPQALQNAAKLGLDFQTNVAEGLGLIDTRTGQINQARLVEAADFAFNTANIQDIEQQNIAINKRIEEVESRGGDATETRQLLQMTPEQRVEAFQGTQLAALPNEKRLEIIQGGDRSKIQFGGQETFKDTVGNIFFATSRRNPQTGDVESVVTPLVEGITPQGQLAPVSGAGVTPTEKVTQRGEIKATEFREQRRSDITKELSTRNRDAARTLPRIQQALTLAQQADQGFTGAVKLKLAKLIPGIDVTDEGQLQSALLSLALDQLQNFKGPTTDFEFGVTQSIVGGIGEAKTANIARLNSLKRAAWFNQREFKQFRDFTRADGDPDDFAFDFNELIKTKKGEFSLQDLQDTAVNDNLSIQEVLKELNK